MTNKKQNIIDAEFSETKTNSETDEKSLIISKKPGKPANSRNSEDTTDVRGYLRLAAYVIIALVVLATAALYLHGMAITTA